MAIFRTLKQSKSVVHFTDDNLFILLQAMHKSIKCSTYNEHVLWPRRTRSDEPSSSQNGSGQGRWNQCWYPYPHHVPCHCLRFVHEVLRNDMREETGHAPHREVDLRGRDYI
jgi:hypothetical protein